MTPTAPIGRTLVVAELLDELSDALGWPRNRPARVVLGDRAARVGNVALCVDDAAIDGITDPNTVAVLLTPPSPQVARRGRRSYDVFEGEAAEEWSRSERVVIDASELLAGGKGGIDAQLAAALELEDPRAGVPVDLDRLCMVSFVPPDSLETVREAVFAAGAGVIGDYTECSWSAPGTGTFRGGESSAPTVGEAGEFEQVAEVRFETTCRLHLRDAVTRAFVEAHPYEEPAFDFLPVTSPSRVGLGRVAGGTIVSVGAATPFLPLLLAPSGTYTTLTCSSATPAERALLAERGIDLRELDRGATLQQFGTTLAGRLSRQLGLKVQLLAPLAFPAEPAPAAAAPTATGSWRLYFDGGSRGNPGPAASAFVLFDPEGNEFERWHQTLGRATNNIAEYTGVLNGLRRAVELGIEDLQVFGDSELIVKQLLGQYKVKNEGMKPLHAECSNLLRRIPKRTVRHVYRSDNAVADALVNEALDAQSARR